MTMRRTLPGLLTLLLACTTHDATSHQSKKALGQNVSKIAAAFSVDSISLMKLEAWERA